MEFTVRKTFTIVVDSVKLTHLLGIYSHIKMPYFYKKDGSVEFNMNEEDAFNLTEAIFDKYADEDYEYLEGMDLDAMNLANSLDDNLNDLFWDKL